VALSRHRESVHIFAARETVKNLDEMAAGMSRADNKRAATAFQIDEQSAARAQLEKAVQEYQPPPASQSFAASIPQQTAGLAVPEAATATIATVEQKEDRRIADIEALRIELQQRGEIAASSAGQAIAPQVPDAPVIAPAVAQQASTFAEAATVAVATEAQIAAAAEAKEDRLIADTFAHDGQTPPAGSIVIAGHAPAATIESAAPEAAPIDAATIVEKSLVEKSIDFSAQEATAPQVAPDVIDALGGLAHGFTKLAEGAAHLAEGAVDLIAGFFGGGGPAPKSAPPDEAPPPKRRLSVEEYVALEIEQRKADRQEIARSLGAGETMTEDELRMEQAKQRDRGGGISR
jgi:hypothetical protein